MSDEYNMGSSNAANSLTAEGFDDLVEALEILYIKNNIGGRLNFYKEWPVAAERVLGADLIRYDTEGADDYELRATLEEEADERRLALLEQLQDLVEKSVVKSALQTEFVEETVKGFGREFALLVYHEKIVNRFVPAQADGAPAGEDEVKGLMPHAEEGYAAFQQTKAGMSDEEKAALEKKRAAAMEEDFSPSVPEDPLDAIQPISLETAPAARPQPEEPAMQAPMLEAAQTIKTPPPEHEPAMQTTDPKPASLPDGFFEIEEPMQTPENSGPVPEQAPRDNQASNPAETKAEMQAQPKQPDVFSSPAEAAMREGVIASDKHVFEVPREPEVAKPPPVVSAPVLEPAPVVGENTAPAPAQQDIAAPAIFSVPKKETPSGAAQASEAPSERSQQRVTMKFVSSKKSDKPEGGSDT